MATSIHVKFRASSVDGKEGTLYYCLTHQRAVRCMSTAYHVYPDEWNEKKSCIIIKGQTGREAKLRLIQLKVNWEICRMQRIIHEREAEAIAYTIDEMADIFRNLPPCQSVFTFVEAQIAKKEKMQRFGTRNNYLHAYRRFCEFRCGVDLTFGQMTADMLEQYEAWLRNRGLRQNSIANYLRTLRALYHKAIEQHLTTDHDIFRHVQTSSVQTQKRAITIQDLRKIEKLALPESSFLALARDLFLFSFYMRGMSFVDMAFLKKTDLRCGMITYCRNKTNQTLSIAWEKPMQTIVAKYEDQTHDSPYMLPLLSGSETDSYAKYKNMEQRVNRSLKKIGEMIGLKIPLTTYVARHSWASIALHMDISLATISEGMGHNSYRTTQIYLQSIDVATIDQANRKILKQVLG